jgi:hypothetical protein
MRLRKLCELDKSVSTKVTALAIVGAQFYCAIAKPGGNAEG